MNPHFVYIVTSGEYSDYHIDGVFDNKSAADALVARIRDAIVEPWNLNDRGSWILRDAWQCTIYIKDGRLDNIYKGKSTWQELADPTLKIRCLEHTFDPFNDGNDTYDYLKVESYISEKYAIKLATEARQRVLRERATNPHWIHPSIP
jgi:hypothetical protein